MEFRVEVLSLQFNRKPAVIMIVGVNGGGKTTSLGKTKWLCSLYASQCPNNIVGNTMHSFVLLKEEKMFDKYAVFVFMF